MIYRLEERHIPQVAAAHLQCLSTRFRGLPGKKLLEAHYRSFLSRQGGVIYVAEDEGRFQGFIGGVWSPGKLRKQMISGSFFSLFWWGTLECAIQPRLFLDLLGRLSSSGRGYSSSLTGLELRPLVVIPEARRRGVGNALVQALFQDASRRGFQKIHLLVEEANLPAISFYTNVGFSRIQRLRTSGITYLLYETGNSS